MVFGEPGARSHSDRLCFASLRALCAVFKAPQCSLAASDREVALGEGWGSSDCGQFRFWADQNQLRPASPITEQASLGPIQVKEEIEECEVQEQENEQEQEIETRTQKANLEEEREQRDDEEDEAGGPLLKPAEDFPAQLNSLEDPRSASPQPQPPPTPLHTLGVMVQPAPTRQGSAFSGAYSITSMGLRRKTRLVEAGAAPATSPSRAASSKPVQRELANQAPLVPPSQGGSAA
eukprot:m.100562 g.100562  ORF g.100562 m.100562 type:complete len:235 (+) comp51473_c0_seq1:529-1233(+)